MTPITSAQKWTTIQNIEHYVRIWEPLSSPIKGTIQLIHGMVEHSGNYIELGETLASNGWLTFISDLAGHGKTGLKNNQLAHLNTNDWNKIIETQIELHHQFNIKAKPHYIIGHSMGSFIAQCIAQKATIKPQGIVLIGSTFEPPVLTKFGIGLLKLITPKKKLISPAHRIHSQIFGRYQQSVKSNTLPFSWLSYNTHFNTQYAQDPFCGLVPSYGFYIELFKGIYQCYSNTHVMKNDTPILLLSGKEDPISLNARKIQSLVTHLQKNGISSIEVSIFDSMRHQILRETNRHLVQQKISRWLDSNNSLNTRTV